MERLAIVGHNSFRAIGFPKSRSPSSPYGPAPQGSQLITMGVAGVDSEQELIGETFWLIPDNFYYDSWHTHIIRRFPLDGCSVSMYGDIFRKGIITDIGTVVNKLTPSLY